MPFLKLPKLQTGVENFRALLNKLNCFTFTVWDKEVNLLLICEWMLFRSKHSAILIIIFSTGSEWATSRHGYAYKQLDHMCLVSLYPDKLVLWPIEI